MNTGMVRKMSIKNWLVLMIVFLSPVVSSFAEANVGLELYNNVYRGKGTTWYYAGSGLADIRFNSTETKNVKAQVSLEFFPQDLTGGAVSAPLFFLKRMWLKVNFPSWRLTAGKTKVAWGNGFVFNSGDILFGSLSPYLDFSQSTIRNDTAFLTAFNIPLGRFSFLEFVLLPPNLQFDDVSKAYSIPSIDYSSGGMRFFFRIEGFRLEGGYFLKNDAKVSNDMLGHRPYLSFHGHAGVDFYGAASLAFGYDSHLLGDDKNRDTWEEISQTVNMSLGAFHQIPVGYSGILSFRLEMLFMPWQNWSRQKFSYFLNEEQSYYGMMIYPEITWNFLSSWTLGLQSIISPVDGSAQITGRCSWNVLQGLTLLGIVRCNVGDENSLFAWDRTPSWSETDWASHSFNGMQITLGARYKY